MESSVETREWRVIDASSGHEKKPARCRMDSKSIYRSETSGPVPRITLRLQEAADALGISISTLDRLTKAGAIPRFKEGNVVLYRVASLEAWAARREALEGGPAA